MKKVVFAVLFSLIAPAVSWAENDRYIVQDPDYQFEVVLDKDQKAANVNVVEAKKDLPKQMNVILYRSKKSPLTVSVHTVDAAGAKPTYTGALDLSQVSYTGVALQWNFNLKSKTLKATKE